MCVCVSFSDRRSLQKKKKKKKKQRFPRSEKNTKRTCSKWRNSHYFQSVDVARMIKEGERIIEYLITKVLFFHREAYQEKVVLFYATLHKVQNLVWQWSFDLIFGRRKIFLFLWEIEQSIFRERHVLMLLWFAVVIFIFNSVTQHNKAIENKERSVIHTHFYEWSPDDALTNCLLPVHGRTIAVNPHLKRLSSFFTK
jgi:hypothetical protein